MPVCRAPYGVWQGNQGPQAKFRRGELRRGNVSRRRFGRGRRGCDRYLGARANNGRNQASQVENASWRIRSRRYSAAMGRLRAESSRATLPDRRRRDTSGAGSRSPATQIGPPAMASRTKLPMAKLASSGSSGPTNAKQRATLTSRPVSSRCGGAQELGCPLPMAIPCRSVLGPRGSGIVLTSRWHARRLWTETAPELAIRTRRVPARAARSSVRMVLSRL